MKRLRADHAAVAAHCRANPKQWRPVGEYNSSQAAASMVRMIKTAYERPGQASVYRPAGAFEAQWSLTEYGADVAGLDSGAATAPAPEVGE